MRNGFAFSIGFHALVLLLIILGLPFFKVKPIELPPPVTVDLVQVAKESTTNKVSPANKVEKEPQPETPPPPPQPKAAPEPPPVPEETPKPPEPAPQPLDTSVPKLPAVDQTAPELPAPPEVTLKQKLPQAPKLTQVEADVPKLSVPQASLKHKLADAPALASVETPKVASLTPPAKVDLKRPEPKTPAKSFDSVLKNLTKAESEDSQSDAPPQPTRTAAHKATGAQAPLSKQLTTTELDALKHQLQGCWNLPASAKDAQTMVVDLNLIVNPDRTVARAEVVDQARMSDPAFAAAARAALRAVRSPNCSPLALPPDKYQEWQSTTIQFDPKELLGQ